MSGVGGTSETNDRAKLGSLVRLEGLTKLYGDVLAVDNIDLDVEAGEFVTLLGPSGSGKTTTLMMIAGFQEVTQGSIRIGDRQISRLPPNERDIGVVFQQYALFPHMTVGENIGFPLRMRGQRKSEIRRVVADVLELVQLSGMHARYPKELSGGQQQRVALARAVVFEPGLTLMDEPLGALDRQLREQMQVEIASLQRRLGLTAIYVTHDQEEALVMSDRIAVMNAGRIEQFASPAVLYNTPATAFVATFVGESNVLRGRKVDGTGTEVVFESETGRRYRGQCTDPIELGAVVVATIRPEKIVVADSEFATSQFVGSCVERTYAGQMSRFVVESAPGERMLLRVQNTPSSRQFALGEEVDLSWEAEHLRVFAGDTGPTSDDPTGTSADTDLDETPDRERA